MSTENNSLNPFGIEDTYADFQNSKYHIISVPYAETVTYIKGGENAPGAILEASTQVELFDITSKSEPYLKGISLSEVSVDTNIQSIWDNIENEVTTCIKLDKFPIMLGGEHSITMGAIKAAKNAYDDITVLQIDAHADLRSEYMDSPYNHACALRHAVESKIPVVQVGIRSACQEEYDFIVQNSELVTTFFQQTSEIDVDSILNSIKTQNVYLTIDLDGLDPSVIPHVGTPEPGGIQWFDLLTLLTELFNRYNVVAADIVELAPNEISLLSDFTAAKLLYKIISLKK